MKNLLFKQNKTLAVTMTALFLALGLILPTAFHAVGLGSAFSPMHLPVLLCGLICGGVSGAIVGFVVPFLGSFLNGMPPLFPTAVAMSLELATYGFVAGLIFSIIKKVAKKRQTETKFFDKTASVWAILCAMLLGRLMYGLAMWICLASSGAEYTLAVFWTSAFAKTLPAVILQIIAIPLIIFTLEKTHVLNSFDNSYFTNATTTPDADE